MDKTEFTRNSVTLQFPPLDFAAEESIKTLRGNIMMSGFGVKKIAFTSSIANEGKSSISLLTAKSFADLKKRTVFIDCDIRNSRIKERTNVMQRCLGLSEYLCGQASANDIIYLTDNPYLDIIFAGRTAPNPSELLSSERFNKLLDQLSTMCDYIILDTPPVDVVIDGMIVSKQCDSTILVISSGRTDRRSAVHVKKQLEAAGIKIMGVVLNRVGRGKFHYGKYGRYGYGRYGYGKYGYGKYGYGKYGYDSNKSSGDPSSHQTQKGNTQ